MFIGTNNTLKYIIAEMTLNFVFVTMHHTIPETGHLVSRKMPCRNLSPQSDIRKVDKMDLVEILKLSLNYHRSRNFCLNFDSLSHN